MSINDFSKGSRVYHFTIAICQILTLWTVITASVFSFNRFLGNEHDVLPGAKQFFSNSWLPNDWYLNLNVVYRQVSNYFFGYLVNRLGFLEGAYIGRLTAYLFLAIAFFALFKGIRLRFSLGLIVLLIYLENQSLIAGEWMVEAADPKTFAYAFALLSFAALYKKRYLAGFAFAGLVLSFHVLIGIYALFCSWFALLLINGFSRKDWKTILRQSWPLPITGIFGFLAIIQQLLPGGEVDLRKAWLIYVELRVPHHVLPSAWNGNQWTIELILAIVLFIFGFLIARNGALKFVAAYALGSVILFITGLALFAANQLSLLRFYWFRYPDVMIPFLSLLLVALLLNQLTFRNIKESSRNKTLTWSQSVLNRGLPLLFVFIALTFTYQSLRYLQGKYHRGLNREMSAYQIISNWIKGNTPRDAIFLINPFINEFYIYANRAVFVSYEHSPQSGENILEWYTRLVKINGDQQLNIPVRREEIQKNFYDLDEKFIQQLSDEYGLTYYLGLAGDHLLFEVAYEDDTYILYKVN